MRLVLRLAFPEGKTGPPSSSLGQKNTTSFHPLIFSFFKYFQAPFDPMAIKLFAEFYTITISPNAYLPAHHKAIMGHIAPCLFAPCPYCILPPATIELGIGLYSGVHILSQTSGKHSWAGPVGNIISKKKQRMDWCIPPGHFAPYRSIITKSAGSMAGKPPLVL